MSSQSLNLPPTAVPSPRSAIDTSSDMSLYQETLLEESRHPSHRGLLKSANAQARYGYASCGDVFTVSVVVNSDRPHTIKDVGWEGEGCVISTASMSVISSLVIGKTVEQARQLSQLEVRRLLGLEQLSPARVKCLTTGLLALQKALRQLQVQNSKPI